MKFKGQTVSAGNVYQLDFEGKTYYFQVIVMRRCQIPYSRLVTKPQSTQPDFNTFFDEEKSVVINFVFYQRGFEDHITYIGNYPYPKQEKKPPFMLSLWRNNFFIDPKLEDNYPPVFKIMHPVDPKRHSGSDYLDFRKSYIDVEKDPYYKHYLTEDEYKYLEYPDSFFIGSREIKWVLESGMRLFDYCLSLWPKERAIKVAKEIEERRRIRELELAREEELQKALQPKEKEQEPTTQPEPEPTNTFTPYSVSMSELRVSSAMFLANLREALSDEGWNKTTRAAYKELQIIVKEFLASISKKKDDKENLFTNVKKTIERINELDEKADHFIETGEAEMLAMFFWEAGAYVGFDTREEVDKWREW